jgi:hypothetical protein
MVDMAQLADPTLVSSADCGDAAWPNDGPERIGVGTSERHERRCERCQEPIDEPRRYRYCSGYCARRAKAAKTYQSRLRYRQEHGSWPYPPGKYWSEKKLRKENRRYQAELRRRRRLRLHWAQRHAVYSPDRPLDDQALKAPTKKQAVKGLSHGRANP